MTGWERTGVWHTEGCGCVYVQQVETGARDYHERWVRLLACPKHGTFAPHFAAEAAS